MTYSRRKHPPLWKKGVIFMSILNKLLSRISITKKDKKPSLIKEVMDTPEIFKLEAYIENEEIVIKIKKRKDLS